MTSRIGVIAFVLAAAMVYGLYEVEHAVRRMDRKVGELQAEVAREREAIRVLNAEWSYLTQPARLQDLVSRHTELQLIAPDQVTTPAAVFDMPDTDEAPASPDDRMAAAPVPAEKPVVGSVRVTFVRGDDAHVQ